MNAQIAEIQAAIAKATEGMSLEDLARHTQPEKWSAAEVIEHLLLTYTGTAKGMELCLSEGRPRVTGQSLRQKVLTFLITRMGYFPQGREAPKQVRPCGTPVEEILPRVFASLQAMDASMGRAEAKFGRGKLLDHPILGAFSVQEWRGFHLTHATHHVKQIIAMRSTQSGASDNQRG